MKQRKLTYAAQALLTTLVVLGIIVIINGISVRKFVRWDLTESKQYTISDSTKNVLSKLDDIITIKLYFSKNLPPVMRIREQQVKDLLDEYRAYSGGNIVVKREDPGEDEELARQVQSIGIPQVQMTFREKDKVEVKNGYLGIGIFYETKHEVLPIVQNVDNLEYDLTSAIKKVVMETIPTVGFLTGHGERDINKDYALIKGAIDQQYETKTVSLENGQLVSDEIDTLIIGGPRTDFSERDLFAIDQFVMRGGKLMVLLDMAELNLEMGLIATPLNLSINKLLESYGIKVNNDMVLDRFNDRLTYSESPNNVVQYITTVNYPYFVKAFKQNFDTTNPIVRGLETLTFPWTSSIDLIERKVKDASVIKLVQSSENAWTQKGRYDLNPKQDFNVPPDQEAQYILAAIVENSFSSYFAGKEIPPAQKSEETPEQAEPPAEQSEPEQIIEYSPTTNIMVIGGSYFITTDSLRRFNSNAVFFLNAVDWLTQGEDLIGIRTRNVTERPVRELSEKVISFIKFINIFGVSLMVISAGLFRMYWRKREKRMYETMISKS
jgi:gliding-associated putative ABC transporter substrate-binding component GldG